MLPFLGVLLVNCINGTAFLAFSSIAERTGRSLSFLGGLAEGTETILVHSVWGLVPAFAGPVVRVWTGLVLLSGGNRMIAGYRILRAPAACAERSKY